jgi:hypothetical protein
MSPRTRGEGRTPHRHLRAEDDVWNAFGAAVQRAGEPDRSTVLRAFMAWYARMPGARMPQRPADAPEIKS